VEEEKKRKKQKKNPKVTREKSMIKQKNKIK